MRFITNFGAAITENRYVGIACKMALTRVSLAGKLKDLNVQFLNLLSILSSTSFHYLALGLPSTIGAPKNFARRRPSENPNILMISLFISF